ncbi:hypothetical protein MPSEU_000407700 [Mayamaea pseudoterrestris]|nr:hypothetical protein MPSEU_000407700 [Mayamaea pseudoterrestris]
MTEQGVEADVLNDNLVQRFLTADEVYVYKIPPLKDAGGHRAEDWNLGSPLQTCRLVVERRGNFLELDFLASNDQIFCQSKVQAVDGKVPTSFLEQVVDSSRYFAIRIQGEAGKQAMIGFGFRDRDKATDLREAIQHYEKSLTRESSTLASYKVPELAAGETIRVNVKGKASSGAKPKKAPGSASGVPLLAKKPPANPDAQDAAVAAVSEQQANPKTVEKIAISIGDIDLDAGHKKAVAANGSDDESSDGAVFTGDETQWATEFDMK